MEHDSITLLTESPDETANLGRHLAALLPRGSVVALHGELASGKTCLVRGMAAFFAQGQPIHSPTFTLVNEYGQDPKLFHLDLYRLHDARDVLGLGYEELLDSDGITVIEWAERAGALLPERRIEIHLYHEGGDRRRIVVRNQGILGAGWPQELEITRT